MKSHNERGTPNLGRWEVVVAVTAAVLLHAAVGAWLFTRQSSANVVRSEVSPIVVRLISAPRALVPTAPSDSNVEQDRGLSSTESAKSPPPVTAVAKVGTPAPSRSAPVRKLDSKPSTDSSSIASNPRGSETAELRYRTAAQLDSPPRPLDDIQPEYPATAGLQQGTVVLKLLISSHGEVDDVTVVDASPKGVFEASAIAAFGSAKFAPGRYLGAPVASQITIAVDYTPTNRGGAVSGQGGLGFLK